MAKSNGLRVPVLVDRALYDQFKAYSDLTGVPIARLVRDAMADYAETSLAARMDALTGSGRFRTPTVTDSVIEFTTANA